MRPKFLYGFKAARKAGRARIGLRSCLRPARPPALEQAEEPDRRTLDGRHAGDGAPWLRCVPVHPPARQVWAVVTRVKPCPSGEDPTHRQAGTGLDPGSFGPGTWLRSGVIPRSGTAG